MNRKYLACIVAIFTCAMLAMIKYLLSEFSGSVSLKADALHSFLDMLTSCLVLLGIWLSSIKFKTILWQRVFKAFDSLISIFIIGLVLYIGFDIFNEMQMANGGIKRPYIAIIAVVISILTNHFLYRFQKKVGKEEESSSILADAFETRMDQFSSILVLISILVSMVGLNSENTFAIIILCMIVINAFFWFVENITLLYSKKIFSIPEIIKNELSNLNFNFSFFRTFASRYKKEIQSSIGFILIILLGSYFCTGIYTIKPGEEAVIQYFGKYIEGQGKEPGLGYVLPWPFASKQIVNVSEIKRIEMKPVQMRNMKYQITKDENLMDVAISMQYKIADVKKYVFNVKQMERLIKDVLESITGRIIGLHDIDDALVHEKQKLLAEMKSRVQRELDRYGVGVQVASIQFKTNSPPREVIRAFNEVSSAREDKRTKVDEAYSYQNQKIPEARGLGYEMVKAAEAYKEKTIENSTGDCNRLTKIYFEYRKNPRLFKQKTILPLIEEISKKMNLKVFNPDVAKDLKIRLIDEVTKN